MVNKDGRCLNMSQQSQNIAKLQKALPWIKIPIVVNAPMGGFAGPSLATSVSRANGLGLIGSTNDSSFILILIFSDLILAIEW